MTSVRPVDISVTRVIRAPRADVADFAGDMGNAPLWYTNIKSVEWVTPPSSDVGASAAFIADFMGRRISYTYEITEHAPGARLVMSTRDGPFPMETVYDWSESGQNTRMTLTNRGFPSGFKAALMPLMGLAMRRAMTKDLAMLDRVLRAKP